MISERSLAVLHAIVSDFVSFGEPVGSKRIVEKHALGVSAATIRNDMAILEEEQLIVAPHTSSGRIPTDKGYRLYVDTLAKIKPLTGAQRNAIENFLGEAQNLDDMMSRTVRLLSNLTNQVAVIQYPVVETLRVRHLELIKIAEDSILCVLITNSAKVFQQVVRLNFDALSAVSLHELKLKLNSVIAHKDLPAAANEISSLYENIESWCAEGDIEPVQAILHTLLEQTDFKSEDKIAVAGTANLTRVSEAPASLPSILEAIEEQMTLLRLIRELVTDQHGVGVSIGRENQIYGFEEASLIATQYEPGGELAARLGVLGPTRMDYARNIAAMRAVSRYVGKFIGDVQL